ncbi:ABC transporter ATP-binding protein [Calidifontibacillus erzurumensis]|uniref:ABC transporter ATP-binding protein n=1 Tax=Calidifontibacillus erzurumensis TaxID=2741433 RepID=A0A8J8GJC6_9BACI|nr:ABC transporter ATP-binding protein [Calidifontibacillus erzurumensis]NSL52816.1 ABC transporter ATP-binding protein [Calidifontibacillus erzurumensis]
MKFLHKYIRKFWLPFIFALFILMVEATIDLLLPTLMASMIDVGVATRNLDEVIKMGSTMVLLTSVGMVAAVLRNFLSSYVSQSFGTELRLDLFRKIQSFAFQTIDKFDRASLMVRLTNDVTQIQMFANGLMRIFVRAPLLCIGALIMAVRLNLHLSIVLAVVVPLIAILLILNMKLGFPRFINVQKAMDRVNGVMREYLSGVRVVKAFNQFQFEVNRFQHANGNLVEAAISSNRVLSVFGPMMVTVMNIGIVAVLWFGGYGVEQGHIKVGEIIAFTNYMIQILFSLRMISMVFTMYVRAKASAERINEVFVEDSLFESASIPSLNGENVFHVDEESRDEKRGPKGSIEFENVSFTYDEKRGEPVLKNITFSLRPGETVGILGSTGSGKTSLANLIPRFYDVSEGSVKVDGKDVRDYNLKELRNKIAIVPQKTMLFTGTIAENIRWGKENATFEEIKQAAMLAEADSFISASPEGYETKLGQGGVNLSGGQKQRISIARALVKQPDILILDDSTSAVDMATEAKIKASLKKYARDLTCVIISQRISSVIDADFILVLDNGKLVGIGSHEELLKNCQVYQDIYRSQTGKEVLL